MSNSSIWPIDRTLSGYTTPIQSGAGSNEWVLSILQCSRKTGTLRSDCLRSYAGHSIGESYSSAEMKSVYSTGIANWAVEICICSFSMTVSLLTPIYIYIYIYIYIHVCVCGVYVLDGAKINPRVCKYKERKNKMLRKCIHLYMIYKSHITSRRVFHLIFRAVLVCDVMYHLKNDFQMKKIKSKYENILSVFFYRL